MDHNERYWTEITRARTLLPPSVVTIETVGIVEVDHFIEVLEKDSIEIGHDGDVIIILTDSYDRPSVQQLALEGWNSKKRVLLSKPVGATIWLGPFLWPDRSGCINCLLSRIRVHHEAFPSEEDGHWEGRKGAGSLSSTRGIAFNALAALLAHYITLGPNEDLEQTLISFNTHSFQVNHHPFIPIPGCSFCGQEKKGGDRSFSNGAYEIRYGLDGGHRTQLPENTLARLEPLCSSVLGVIHSVERVPPADSPIQVYQAFYRPVSSIENRNASDVPRYRTALGKGQTHTQAKVSALSEAVERLSAYYRGTEALRMCSLNDLGEEAIHPNQCMLYSKKQYQSRQGVQRSDLEMFFAAPEPIPVAEELPWAALTSLRGNHTRYIPAAYCYFGFPDRSSLYCRMDTNGLAAGNTREEAILQGFLELIERDAVALWWYNMIQRPRVDTNSFDLMYLNQLDGYYQSINRQYWVIDVTTDFNIPVFVAISTSLEPASNKEFILYGTGAHFDARIALLRAITEMNQGIPAILSMRNEKPVEKAHRPQIGRMDQWPSYMLDDHPYLEFNTAQTAQTKAYYPKVPYSTIKEAIAYIKELLSKKSLDLYYIDQSRPDLQLKAVKVIVPGLRPYWRRLAPGRLYDIPVSLNWIDSPIEESQMNPHPISR